MATILAKTALLSPLPQVYWEGRIVLGPHWSTLLASVLMIVIPCTLFETCVATRHAERWGTIPRGSSG